MSSDWGVFSLAGKVVVVTGGTGEHMALRRTRPVCPRTHDRRADASLCHYRESRKYPRVPRSKMNALC